MDENKNPDRLLSLDVLRGLDMFFITGGALLISRLAAATDWGIFNGLAAQMVHVPWQGIKLFDLIFPLFMFISGVAIPFALQRHFLLGRSKSALYVKIIRRAMILICLGLIYNGLFNFNFSNFRYASVLAQIGVAYLIAALLAMKVKRTGSLMVWTAAILAVYGLIQKFLPVPGSGAGMLTPEGSINGYIDQLLLPGKLNDGTYDPEGILCMVSASAITLMGVIAGRLLRQKGLSPFRKAVVLASAGIALLFIGLLPGNWYPIIKNLWTTTFNLAAGGISLLLLAVFYLVIDVWRIRKWCFYFQVIGLNAITVYMGAKIFRIRHSADFLFADFGPIVQSLAFLAIVWLALYVLYRHKIFLRV